MSRALLGAGLAPSRLMRPILLASCADHLHRSAKGVRSRRPGRIVDQDRLQQLGAAGRGQPVERRPVVDRVERLDLVAPAAGAQRAARMRPIGPASAPGWPRSVPAPAARHRCNRWRSRCDRRLTASRRPCPRRPAGTACRSPAGRGRAPPWRRRNDRKPGSRAGAATRFAARRSR